MNMTICINILYWNLVWMEKEVGEINSSWYRIWGFFDSCIITVFPQSSFCVFWEAFSSKCWSDVFFVLTLVCLVPVSVLCLIRWCQRCRWLSRRVPWEQRPPLAPNWTCLTSLDSPLDPQSKILTSPTYVISYFDGVSLLWICILTTEIMMGSYGSLK